MTENGCGRRFIISSLPRCGSTTFARLLNCHPMLRCLIEPFHPKRYGGNFHSRVRDASTLSATLACIWTEWTGIKHVWEANGWPFALSPSLNELMLLGNKVIIIKRRNWLKRYISHYICRYTNYWIGTKDEFQTRIAAAQIPPLQANIVRKQIRRDMEASTAHLKFIQDHDIMHSVVEYEDFYLESDELRQYRQLADLMRFVGVPPLSFKCFSEHCRRFLDPEPNQWASSRIYKYVPGVDLVERELRSERMGSIFDE